MVTNSIDRDTFAGFVEAVARNLGDGAVSSGGFAAQAFLSRSQFDRVIRATAGEPPASFQRRVLLERAAYQLATSRSGHPRCRARGGLLVARGVRTRVPAGVWREPVRNGASHHGR